MRGKKGSYGFYGRCDYKGTGEGQEVSRDKNAGMMSGLRRRRRLLRREEKAYIGK